MLSTLAAVRRIAPLLGICLIPVHAGAVETLRIAMEEPGAAAEVSGKSLSLGRDDEDMTALISRLADLRRRFPQLRSRHWVEGRHPDGTFGASWLTPQGTEMTEQDWNFPEGRFLSYVLDPLEQGGTALFIVLNAAMETIEVTLPVLGDYRRWTVLLDTAPEPRHGQTLASGAKLQALPRSVLAFSGMT